MGLFGTDRMSLELEEVNYRPDDVIRGTVQLKLNKPTKARKLVVALLGKMKSTRRDIDGDLETRDETVYKFELPLDGEKEYYSERYPFEIKIQSDILQTNTPGTMIHKEFEKRLGGLGSILAEMTTGQKPIRWMVMANLDIPMRLDASMSQDIVISLDS